MDDTVLYTLIIGGCLLAFGLWSLLCVYVGVVWTRENQEAERYEKERELPAPSWSFEQEFEERYQMASVIPNVDVEHPSDPRGIPVVPPRIEWKA